MCIRDRITTENALPAICGRVCPQENQCEGHCVLGRKGAPVHFSTIENYISSTYANQMTEGPKPSNGMRVAIIGSGPAGLTCAGDLAKKGYEVTVFEAFHTAGGVLVYGIPEFRLPKAIVKKEVENLQDLGVEVKTNMVIGRVLSVDELFEMGYKAIFIGSGAGLPSFMGIEGEDLIGVYSCLLYTSDAADE